MRLVPLISLHLELMKLPTPGFVQQTAIRRAESLGMSPGKRDVRGMIEIGAGRVSLC